MIDPRTGEPFMAPRNQSFWEFVICKSPPEEDGGVAWHVDVRARGAQVDLLIDMGEEPP